MIFTIGAVLFIIGLAWQSTLGYWDEDWKRLSVTVLINVGLLFMLASLGMLAVKYLP